MKRRFGLIKCIGAFFRRSITGCGQKSWHFSETSLLDLPTVWAGQINHLLYPFVQINLPWCSTDRRWNKTVLSQTVSATKRFHQAAKHPLWPRRHRRHLTAKPIVVIFSELIFSDRVCTLLTNCKTVGLLRQLGGKKKRRLLLILVTDAPINAKRALTRGPVEDREHVCWGREDRIIQQQHQRPHRHIVSVNVWKMNVVTLRTHHLRQSRGKGGWD